MVDFIAFLDVIQTEISINPEAGYPLVIFKPGMNAILLGARGEKPPQHVYENFFLYLQNECMTAYAFCVGCESETSMFPTKLKM